MRYVSDDTATSLHRTVSALIGGDLHAFVTERRRRGFSWRRISVDIRDATGGAVDLAGETIRRWFPDETAP